MIAPPAALALTYNTSNVGDDIQTLAMLQHAPPGARVVWCDRDQLASYDGPPARLVANGWWAHGDSAWPPPRQVEALPTSMHVQIKSRGHFASVPMVDPLLGSQVVGARDTDTLEWLRSRGVAARFSGCMTLTFPRVTGPRSFVCAVDLRGRDFNQVCREFGRDEIIRATHTIPRDATREQRLAWARERLHLYAQASMVVTTRLHAALPCIAMGTPVLLVGRSNRFTGLDRFVTVAPRVTPAAIVAASRFEPCHHEVAAALAAEAREFLAPCST